MFANKLEYNSVVQQSNGKFNYISKRHTFENSLINAGITNALVKFYRNKTLPKNLIKIF